MSSIKTYNPITKKWEVRGTSTAGEVGIIDTSSNFTSNNVEGALRELSATNQQQTSAITSINQATTQVANDFKYHIDNHPSGGGGTAPTITSDFKGGAVDADTSLVIPIFFTSPNLGSGTAYIMIGGVEVGMQIVTQGNNNITVGVLPALSNNIQIYVKDRVNQMSNQLSWTVIKGGVDLTLQFDYSADYSVDDIIRMPYTINTASTDPIKLNLTIGSTKYEINAINGYNEYIFTGLGVGVHKISLYASSGIYKSKVYNFNLVIVNAYNLYVSTTFEGGSFEYGIPINIEYRVSKASNETFTVNLYIDDVINKTLYLKSGQYYWTINNLGVGDHKLKIEALSSENERMFIESSVTIISGEYTPVDPVTSGLLAWFDATGYTNQDGNKEKWVDKSGNNVQATLKNFNYYTNGWMNDTLVCDSSAYVEIDLKPYEDNVKLGSTIDILYKSKNIGFEEARILDYTQSATPYKGIYANVLETTIKSLTNSLKVNLDEEVYTRLTYVIDRTNTLVKIYVNGVVCGAFKLSDSGSGVNKFYEDFTHSEKIYINSEKGVKNFGACEVKNFRVYGRALSHDEVLQNHIADIKDIAVQKNIYDFNYNNKTTPEIRMYGDTTNMSPTQSVEMRVKYTSPSEDMYGASFDQSYCQVAFQGTSSIQYPSKNYTVYLKDENKSKWYYTPFRNGMLEDMYTLKADFIDSSHCHNTGLAKFINDCVYDTKTPAQLKNANYRTTINGFPILLYINDKLEGVYNFNNDRYSENTFGYKEFPNTLVYEVSANSDVTAGAFNKWTAASGKSEIDYYKSDFKVIYPETRNASDNFVEIKRLVEWVDTSSDEVFKAQIGEYFNLEYLIRYFLNVIIFCGVDSLGFWLK